MLPALPHVLCTQQVADFKRLQRTLAEGLAEYNETNAGVFCWHCRLREAEEGVHPGPADGMPLRHAG